MAPVEPMTDRRTIVLILAMITALGGVAMAVVALISLQDPFAPTGEIGTRTEISGELITATILGVLLAVTGTGIAISLVRAQLRGAHH